MNDVIRQAFSEHLAAAGYIPDQPRDQVVKKLRERMGEQRFNEFATAFKACTSASAQEEVYTHFDDIVEGNLLRSMDPGATFDASLELYEQCVPLLEPGARVIELGSWTGGLASFIAARHPECEVVGVDLGAKIIESCKAYYQLPNLSFRRWNYRWAKPEDLEPADVILCSLGIVHHPPDHSEVADPNAVRNSRDYITQRDHAIGYCGFWRSAIRDGGTLLAILRVQLVSRFLAWIDAGQATGWTPRLDKIWSANMTREKGSLPGLLFEAQPSDPIPEDVVLDRWTWFIRHSDMYACIIHGEALVTFRAMTARKRLAWRRYRYGGALYKDEVGVAGGVGYVFSQDTFNYCRLLLISLARAKQIAVAISDKEFRAFIADDSTFTAKPARAKAETKSNSGDPGQTQESGATAESSMNVKSPFLG